MFRHRDENQCWQPRRARSGRSVTDARSIVLAGADERALATLTGYREVGGYEQLTKARRMEPQQVLAELLAAANASPRSYRIQMLAAVTLAKAGQTDTAITLLERARALFPEYGGPDGPYAGLAQLYASKGDSKRAADALSQYVLHNETDYASHLELARLRTASGDNAGAADALDRAIYIDPYDVAVHQQLAGLYHGLGDKTRTVRERRAVVALAPADRSEAFYQLALAYHEADDDVSARKALLRSLEEAPNYVKSQELLLTIVDGKKP